ncbi:MAG: SDR family NAD(P)-dependent oxidoreductase [Solirubrobacteraceae bacterium]|nr:SDR family NAD(P)-dependent oxidoreductase [Solirubrobacteraceae bacterium]
MSTEFDGKVAIVTGGAGGIGAATARGLAARGATVVVSDLDEPGGRLLADEIGGDFVPCDVSDFDANARLVEEVVQRHGGLDLVHLNAGVSTGCSIGEDFDLALYRRAMGANLDGVFFGLHHALPALKARGGGAIVATASLAGLVGMPFDSVYTANKHAVVGLVRSAGPALVADGIRLNALCPGFAESGITAPIADALAQQGFPMMTAEQPAEAAIRLFSEDVSGECWFVQAGREPAAFQFRNVPGPRTD